MSDFIGQSAFLENSLAVARLHTLVLDALGGSVDYIFDAVNRAFEKLTGLRREAVIGKSVLTVLPGTNRLWIERLGPVALHGPPASFEARSEELGKWLQIAAYRHQPLEFTVCFIDVTDRILEHERLVAAEEKYKALFELGSAKMVIDPHTGAILSANPMAAEFYGYALEELEGMNIGQINNLSMNDIQKEMESATNRRRNVFSFRHKRADGEVVDVEVHSSPARWNGQDALFSIILDVTELTLLRKRVIQEERLAAIGSVTSSLNHEFGNLLGILNSQFKLLELKMEDTPENRRIGERLQQQFVRSRKLVDSIKRLSRTDRPQRERLRLSQIIGDVVQLESPICKEKRINIDLDLVEDDWVDADVSLTQQVFLNLFNNAVQALDGVQDPIITIAVRKESSEVVVRVANNGVQIPAEVRTKLFAPFFTTKATDPNPGSGLGLSFSASVVHSHGGVIFLEDRPETVFQIRLPLAE